MPSNPYYPRYMGDYARDTAHLSQGEHGAYDLLLDWQYANSGPLPGDRRARFRITKAFSRQEKRNADTVVAEFFLDDGDGLWNPRAKSEIYKLEAIRRQKSEGGKKGARKRWDTHKDSHKDSHLQTDGTSMARARGPSSDLQDPRVPGSGLPPSPARAPARGADGDGAGEPRGLAPDQRAEAERIQAGLEQRKAALGVAPEAGPRLVRDVGAPVAKSNPGAREPGFFEGKDGNRKP